MIGREEVIASLERVLSSDEAGGNPRRAKLLQYLVTETLEGREDRLKGTSIAMDVFDRPSDFDPSADAVVRSEARRLRLSLASYYVGAGAADPVVISIPKGGYVPRFTSRAGQASQAATDAGSAGSLASAATPVSDPEPPPGGAVRWPFRAATIARSLIGLVLITGIVLSVSVVRQNRSAAPASLQPTVMVIPIEAKGASPDMQALASGITAQVVSDLMRFPAFRLHSFEDSLRARQGMAEGKADADFDADFVVRGILHSDAETVAIIVRVIETAENAIIWSEAFVRPLQASAIASLQAEISGEIASRVGEPYGVLRIRPVERAVSDEAGVSGLACVMRAHSYRHANRYDLYQPARACLDELVQRDPTYAEAWALLAYLRLDGGRFGYEARTLDERDRAYAEARNAATAALGLDPDNELAISALAMIEHYAGRFEESLRYSALAVQANPNDPSTLAYHGWRLGAQGRLDEGLPFVEEAIARSVNPQPTFFHVIAIDRLMAGDMEGMLAAAQRASVDRSSPSDAFLAIALGGLGATEEAEAALASMARKWPLMGQDPAAAFGWHNLYPDHIDAIVAGLERAGWRPPPR